MRSRLKIVFTLLPLVLFTSSLFATDAKILTHYRNNGIELIQQKLDKQLAQKKYWDEYLQNIDTSFGYFETYKDILTCDKSQSKLSLYKKDKNKYILQREYDAYTGKYKGDKEKEGDLKTPVGVYKIVKKITKVDSFYGPMAFVTSYPNLYDQYKNKTGQGIWIHGLPIEQERDEFTKGCIAINNKSIECLDRNIDINQTLLIINENAQQQDVSKKELAQVLTNLFQWRYAWIYNDLETYLSFYSPEFKRFDGVNFESFKNYKTRIFNKKEKKTIIFNAINVIPYPNHNNIYEIRFKEQYKSDSFAFNGNKILIVKLKDKQFKIITEK
jgi:murein L,D-transpeptidase YafK